ncbi:MAG: amidohydrolase family protein [Paracoccaceae bacterium]|jgi:cytosine/adenosine deaminase-related metal-dependent hydrolase|uniref:amidohydrolase family protein n=1 Tax=unclassified Seohaeicola TaxID=2641111 RepID=UPI00237A5A0C|nr:MULTISPECIES: amidohydrolase family protein [unclassified Seohaeicola]MDD9707736.1 amidohydrolase family protein [Seohaeicola sp. 4SK31]MDD9735978.1 amidohydrolase family protein [Seohaeicola sp. SP36]MDF1708574.1 amidohydrolase family protein [Paracoccaceae bacterium]
MTDLLIRNLRPMGAPATDLLIRGGRIAEIASGITAPGIATEDAGGAIATPGLVEAHTHLDKTVMGMGWYENAVGTDLRSMINNERRARRELGLDPARQSMRHALALVGNGTTHIRSHVDVDTDNGLSVLEGVLNTRDTLRGVVEIEIVAFPQSGLMIRPGTLELLDEAMAMGADLVGGLDPCGIDRDPKGHLDAIFALADKHGRGIDIHLHEPGDMGAFSLELILERTAALGMKGKVAVSHAFCLGMPDWNRVEVLLAELAEQDVAILTTGAPSREVPNLKRVRGAGLRMGAGCDGVLDTWNPWNRPDMLDRARIVAQKNNLRADADLALALDLVTTGGAAVMGVMDHRLAVGNPADLALLPGRTLAEAVAMGGPVQLTVKGGRVTGRGGKPVMEAP